MKKILFGLKGCIAYSRLSYSTYWPNTSLSDQYWLQDILHMKQYGSGKPLPLITTSPVLIA